MKQNEDNPGRSSIKVRPPYFNLCCLLGIILTLFQGIAPAQIPGSFSPEVYTEKSAMFSSTAQVGRQELQRMARLKNYSVKVGESYYDLMKETQSAQLTEFFQSSHRNREGYKKVAAVEWGKLWGLKTNLIYVAQFPGPVPPQLRAAVERVLGALTNSPAVSSALRDEAIARTLLAPPWELGNLNASCPDDMRSLLEQLQQYPADSKVYVDGLRELFEAAKGYYGPSRRREALRVYLTVPEPIKYNLRITLAKLGEDAELPENIRTVAAYALHSLDTLWVVTVNGKPYHLNTVEGLRAFLIEANVNTHYMDQLHLFHSMIVQGRSHPELREVASWLAHSDIPRFKYFLENIMSIGETSLAETADEMIATILKIKNPDAADPRIQSDADDLAGDDPDFGQASLATRARHWIGGHLGYIIAGSFLLLGVVPLSRVAGKVRFGGKAISKQVLYPVADHLMNTCKEKATESLPLLQQEADDTLRELVKTQEDFVARHPDRDYLEYMLRQLKSLSGKKGIRNVNFTREVIAKAVDKEQENRTAIVETLLETFPHDLPDREFDTEMLQTIWTSRVLANDGMEIARELSDRYVSLRKKALRCKSVAYIGRNEDNYPPPEEVRETMQGIGVDLGKIIDDASRQRTSAWEPRYLMNRHPDLVLAAYYKRHFNKFIELTADSRS